MTDVGLPFEELRAKLARMDTLGLPVPHELNKLCQILPYDEEMAVVRGRRIVDMIMRAIFSKHISPAGTRPLEQLVADLEREKVIPREIAAHIRSLKEIANLCAHEGTTDEQGLTVCLIDLAVILKWFVRYLEQTAQLTFRAVDGLELSSTFDEVEDIFEIDRKVYGSLEEASLGSYDRSRSWFQKNPQIYTLLFCSSQIVGYCNVMPLEDEAFEIALRGELQDGLITSDMIRTYELPGSYKLYICSLAILPEFRRNSTAFRTLYDAFFEKLFRLADAEIFVTEIACNAWTVDGQSLARSFGMSLIGRHVKHGEIYHCTIIPPSVKNPVSKLRLLLKKYKDLGMLPEG